MTRSGARALRVLVVGHTAELGGAELALVRLCSVLERGLGGAADEGVDEDVDVRAVLLADGPLVGRLAAAGVPVTVLPADPGLVAATRGSVGRASWRNLRRLLPAARVVAGLRAAVRAARPDVVHTTTLKAHVLGLVAGRLCGVPVVWYVHDRIAADYLPARTAAVLRWLARLGPRAVLANSGATAATLPGVRDLTVAYPGFAPEQVRPLPSAVSVARSPCVVGLVGRVGPTKGQLELVRAMPAVLARHPGTIFRCVGAPAFGAEAYAREVGAEARRLGVDGHLELTGFVADPAAALGELTVCVHASPVPEPFGQVVVEAMVGGVPVVATDAGGVPEILRDGDDVLGRLVPPGDVRALAEAIIEVLDDVPAALAVARRAHASALERFAVTTTARTVTEVWRRSARPRRAPARLRRA